jgi:hypothetical protein
VAPPLSLASLASGSCRLAARHRGVTSPSARSQLSADPLGGRNQIVRVSILIGTLVLAVVSTAVPAHACKCDPTVSFEQRYKDAGLVFFGVAAAFHRSPDSDRTQDFWEFEIQGVWKGPAQDHLRVYLHEPGVQWSDCDYRFEQSESYLVYAHTDPGIGYENRYRTDLCSGSVIGSDAHADISLLGQPKHRFRK